MRQKRRIAGRRVSFWRDMRGQGTVEYLIVGLAILVVIIALGVLANRLQEGLFVEHAIESASHAAGPNTMGVIGDVLLY
ncbi:MAG: hypothetical protein LBU31_02120 [Coriobacteriales bacterium]|nr:hypothetical protein [Coriobacteriales bacterium]